VTILEFLEEGSFPQRITIERTNTTKYLFYLVVRAYHIKFGLQPTIYSYSKKTANTHRSTMEEHSFWNWFNLFVLEGFSKTFVDRVQLPNAATKIVAETDHGELTEDRLDKVGRRGILKILSQQMGLSYSLRALLKLDWTSMTHFGEFEVVLRRAKILGWTEEQIGDYLLRESQKNLLTLLKRGKYAEILDVGEKKGYEYLKMQLTRWASQLMHFKALKVMGTDDRRIQDEVRIGWGRLKELEEAGRMYSDQDLTKLAKALVAYDMMTLVHPAQGMAILLKRTGISLRG